MSSDFLFPHSHWTRPRCDPVYCIPRLSCLSFWSSWAFVRRLACLFRNQHVLSRVRISDDASPAGLRLFRSGR